MGVEHGRLLVAAVPQVPGKMSFAVFDRVPPVRPVGAYVFRIFVPKVPGKFCCAQVAKAGSGELIVAPPVAADERRGSTEKKKKSWWCGIIGPPIAPEKLLL
jgi:hypothetical protein